MIQTPLTKLAYEIASEAHANDTRRGGLPYMSHIDNVVEIATRMWPQTIGLVGRTVVACLHDVIEDHPDKYSRESLIERGIPGAYLVELDLLTHNKDMPYDSYIARIHKSGYSIARHVKIADLLDNLTDSPSPKQVAKYTKALRTLLLQ